MPLEKKYVRQYGKVIGNVTEGFDDGHGSVVRDADNRIIGRTSTRFNETRDSHGRVVSSNSADAGLLIKNKR